MAEIKSTLDLVMQKTRHMTLTEKEKEDNRKKALSQQIRGLVQQYMDGLIDAAGVKHRLGAEPAADKVLADEILDRIDPERKNQRLLALLKEAGCIDTRRLAAAIDDYHCKQRDLKTKRMDQLAAQLVSKRGIGGPAVVPNLDKDDIWRRERSVMKTAFSRYLKKEKMDLDPLRQQL